jgi:hypothetical protein
VNLQIPEVRQDVLAAGEVRSEEQSLCRHVHVDHVVAVRRAEVHEHQPNAAQLDFHRVLECDLRNDGPPFLTDDVVSDVHVPDADSRVGKDLRVADVALVVVAQHHVFHGHLEPSL